MKRKIIVALTLSIAVGIGTAIASGIPTVQPLTYSGVLQNSAGAAVTTSQSMQLTLWDDASANASANQKCVTPTQNVTPDAQGRFQIRLDQACFDAVRANPNLWVQVQVGAVVLPRSKIGAVPYAVEAGRASRTILSATTFGADGGLKTTANGLYCGATANTTGTFTAQAGAITGLRAAKFLCEQTCGSPTAHMCRGHEASQSYELGMNLPGGWLAGVAGLNFSGGSPPNTNLQDCYNWSTSMSPGAGGYYQLGTSWDIASNTTGTGYCNGNQPILCCD